jgi:hypothetical protein
LSEAGDRLLQEARAWVRQMSPHVAHLERTEQWALELSRDASLAVRLAALTHDMERAYPEGSPRWEPGRGWDDPLYNMAHSERSARIVGDFLRDQGAQERFVREVVRLVVFHETGGFPEADVVQAADSLSFLETMVPVVAGWVTGNVAPLEYAQDRLRYAARRIRHRRGRQLAEEVVPVALEQLDEAVARARA